MPGKLAIGFGNVYRRDDGVGVALVNALRERLGRPILEGGADGFDDLGHEVDAVVAPQLVPELAATIADYDLVVFLDAHMGTITDPIFEQPLEACYRPATFSHHLHPCTLLVMSHELYGRCPRGVLLSVRGHDFEFGEGLSAETAQLLPQALQRLLYWLEEES